MAHGGVEHGGAAVGEDGGELILGLHRLECRHHLRVGIELEVERHDLVLEARLLHAELLERIVECLGGDMPEIGVHAHEAPEPGIFELLLAPQAGDLVRLLADLG